MSWRGEKGRLNRVLVLRSYSILCPGRSGLMPGCQLHIEKSNSTSLNRVKWTPMGSKKDDVKGG
jgi:hypothetical protein